MLAAGTLAVGLGGVAALVSSRRPGGKGDSFAAFAIAAALLTSGLAAVRVLAGEPTPTLKLT